MSKHQFQKMNMKHSRLKIARVVSVLLLLLCLMQGQAMAQLLNISGTVIDSNHDPLAGVSVMVKGTTRGVMTSISGSYDIQAEANAILVFSFMGMATREEPVNGRGRIDVTLSEGDHALEDVVITAFGTAQKKVSAVGAIQSIRPSDLKVPSSNLSTSFAGRLAGVVAFQRGGQPGSNSAEFYIRGISTLSGVTKPLIILDGVEVSQNDLDALDPEVIEGFSILKDATATAMYGTRGANGVMIVKTKSGANLEKPIIGVRVETYVNTPTSIPKFVNAETYMRLFNEAVTNQKENSRLFTESDIAKTLSGENPVVHPNVDWYNEVFKDFAFNQKANFYIRGGTEKITYFMNVAVNHETGMLRDRAQEFYSYSNNFNLQKYAFQNNVDFHMTKTSTISLHLNVQLYDMRSPNQEVSSLYNQIMNANPVDYPVMYDRGADEWIHWGVYGGGNTQGAHNVLADLVDGYKDTFESTVIANMDFDQKLDFITEGLSFKALVSFKNWGKTTTTRSQYYNKYFLNYVSADGMIVTDPMGTPQKYQLGTSNGTTGDRRIYAQSYFSYNRSLSNNNFDAMLLWNIDQYDSNNPGDLIATLPQRKMGFAGRISYDYAQRYLLELNAGYNGSENFAEGHRWGFFPSVAAGWNISQESFFKPAMAYVSNLKLRGSFGLVGNDQIGGNRFIYLDDISLTGASYQTGYGGATQWKDGPTYRRYENPDITWEVGQKLDIGVDVQLLNSVNVVVDWFREVRGNIFQQMQSIPNYFGTANTAYYGNLAKVENKGFDASVDYGKRFSSDWSVQLKATFTYARNKVLEYNEPAGVRPTLSQIGRKQNIYMGYITDGLYLDAADIANSPASQLANIAIAPGDIKYVDMPDAYGYYDGKIDADDRAPLGYPTVPEIVYGFGPSVQWKSWDFSFFFQGVANTSLMMSGFHPFGTQSNRSVLQFIADNHWSEENQDIYAAYPRLTKYDNDHNTQSSDYWLRDASFLKLKNVELGYSFKMLRVYFSVINAWTFSSFKEWDPEMGGGGGLRYPTQRTFNLGVQMTFK
jgi:TonB-linked SusC/RagA family outer membrane protein